MIYAMEIVKDRVDELKGCYEDSFQSPTFLYKQHCEYSAEAPERQRFSPPRKTGRAYRRAESIAHDERARFIVHLPGYNPSVGWIDTDAHCVEVGTHVKYPKNSNMRMYWKRVGAKCVRSHKGSIPDGSAYKKIFDLRWRLF